MVARGVREGGRLNAILDRARARGATVETLPRSVLDELTGGANHQGVALVAGAYRYEALPAILNSSGTVLILDHLEDPQNFGTLLRAAEATAVAGVVLPQDRAVSVTPAVVSASAGAVEHLKIARVPNLVRAVESVKMNGRWALALDTGPDAIELFATDLPSPIALVVGSEGAGISPLVRRHCDLIVSLPMRGRVSSINASTAGAVALFELVRRERS